MWPFKKKEQAVGRTINGEEPRPFKLPAKRPAKHQTAADVLDWMCQQNKATYERSRTPNEITVRLFLPSGDVVSGRGKTTLDAVTAASKKLEALVK